MDYYAEYLNDWREKYLARRTGNGYLAKYHNQIEDEWREWVYSHQPMTKTRYRAEFSKEERMRHGPTIWAGELRSGGEAEEALREIMSKYTALAKADAEADRAARGWTGPNHLTAPDGSTTTATGYRYGVYHDGVGYEDRRKWYER